MKTKIKYLIIALLLSSFAFGQDKKTVNADMVWIGYFNSVKLNSRFAINSDLQGRTRNSLLSQYVTRTGLVFGVNSKLYLVGGFAAFFYPQSTDQNLLKNEWRPWEEVMIADNIGNLKINHRFRAEQRYNQVIVKNDLTDDYSYTNRFRYKIDLQYPLFHSEKVIHAFYFIAANELMINTGKSIKYNYFDQNRTSVGISYKATQSFTFQVILMHIWQQQSNGYTVENDKVLRFNIYHTINASRSTEQQ
ncbi:MAG: DUF2490 domain-containing protein [Bacteroidia bacterium]